MCRKGVSWGAGCGSLLTGYWQYDRLHPFASASLPVQLCMFASLMDFRGLIFGTVKVIFRGEITGAL